MKRIAPLVAVNQIWHSNDMRRPRKIRILKIIDYVTGGSVQQSNLTELSRDYDRVRVATMQAPWRKATILRKHFDDTTRGWTLTLEV